MSGSYDRALTVFSPDGHLHQVEYAAEAAAKGTCLVGVLSDDAIFIGVERRAIAKLQCPRTAKKIAKLDETLLFAYSGLQADARVILDMAQLECQSYRLNLEVQPSVDYIGRYIAGTLQKYTIRGGRRPFGLNALIAGFTTEKQPRLLQTEPHGILTSWKAQALGKNARVVREYLEKHLTTVPSQEEALKMVVSALYEVVETSPESLNIEVVRLTKDSIFTVPEEQIIDIIQELDNNKQAAQSAETDT